MDDRRRVIFLHHMWAWTTANMFMCKPGVILGIFGFSVHCSPERVLWLEPSTTNQDNYEKKQKQRNCNWNGGPPAGSIHVAPGGVRRQCREWRRSLRPTICQVRSDTRNLDLFRKCMGKHTHQSVQPLLRHRAGANHAVVWDAAGRHECR